MVLLTVFFLIIKALANFQIFFVFFINILVFQLYMIDHIILVAK